MTIRSVRFRMATSEDVRLQTYDNTKLVAMNTCPIWGILRYQMHKQMPGSGRAMALEAGQAMHDVFAWVRLMSWTHQRNESLALFDEPFWYHGTRLFGVERVKTAVSTVSFDEDIVQQTKMSALNILETSGFYDDPKDRRRTLSNLEECVLAYIDRWRWTDPVWMRHVDNPMGDIGIEIPFDLAVEVDRDNDVVTQQFRLTGKIDGIHVHNGKITLHENKTASRLSEAWSMSFSTSSQVTGYCVAASTFTEESVRNAIVHGLAIPLPKSYDYGGVVREHVSRTDYQIQKWIEWLVHTIDMYNKWDQNPYDAPQYTHSCNRYFRPCSFIPFCDTDREDQVRVVQDMVTEEWSPLHEKTGE